MDTNKHKKISKLSITISTILLFVMLSFPALATECPFENKEGYFVYYDTEFATELSNDTKKYIDLLNAVDFQSFKGKNMSPSRAVALKEGIDETILSMEVVYKKIRQIKIKSQCLERPDTVKEWVAIAKQISKVHVYIVEIENANILKDEEYYSSIFNMRLSIVFNFIEARLNNTTVIK